MADEPNESVWKRLARLFRSGPVVRHKIASGEKLVQPQGSASAYKKELSSLYVRSLASYANHERLARYHDFAEMELTPELHSALDIYCLAGDTNVLLLDGVKTIEELYLDGRENFYVYSFDLTRNKIVPGKCKRVLKTGVDQQVYKVNLDNGNFVRLTGEHLVLLSSGEYCAVNDLRGGEHIRSLYRKFSSKQAGDFIDGYEMLFQPTGKWQYSHRVVANELCGRCGLGDVIHHIDFNKLNNNPENLKFMSRADHHAVHLANNSVRWKNDPAFVARMKEKFSQHAKKMHAQPGWTRDVFLKRRAEVFAAYTDEQRKEKFGRRGSQNGMFGKGLERTGPQNSRFNHSWRREFSRDELLNLIDSGTTIRNAAVILNTSVVILRQQLKIHGIDSWKKTPSAQTFFDNASRIREKINTFQGNVNRGFKTICESLGLDDKQIRREMVVAGYPDWSSFIESTNHIIVSVECDGSTDVYDLEVEDYHNFAVSGQKSDDYVFVHNSDEVTVKDEDGHVITVTSKNSEIKEVLEELFFDVLNLDFNAWSWVRHLCKYGDLVLFIDANEENGLLNLFPIPINEIEREEGFDPKDPMAVRFRWLTRGNTILENWQIIHFRLLGNDSYLPYGCSILEPARRIWRQLILIEDAMLVYRIVRSPERRVFNIEVGAIPPEQVEPFMEQVKTQLKRNTIIDPDTGRVDLRYNAMSTDEDYYLPKRGDVMSTIDTLQGGQFTGDIEDVQYIQSKLFAAIKIPRAYLGYEDQLGSKATLAQEDIRFAKTTERIQELFKAELNKIAIVHLYLLGYRGQDLANFEISMAAPSSVAQQQRLELWRMKLEVAGMAQEGVFDRGTIWRRIFGLNDREIAKIKEGKRIDALEDALLEGVGAGGAAPGGGEGGPPPGPGSGPELGAEELPTTLGGPPGGGPPELAGRSIDGSIVTDAKNMGSTGDRAEIAVDKGKNLFAPGESQFNHSFGRKKQTASDPYDRRSSRRTITRPFSESPDDDDSTIEDGLSTVEDLDHALEVLEGWLRRRPPK